MVVPLVVPHSYAVGAFCQQVSLVLQLDNWFY